MDEETDVSENRETPLDHVIGTAMRGDDKYKRWPLPEMCAAQDEIRTAATRLAEAEEAVERETQAVSEVIAERDAAESALGAMYAAVMGSAPEWSNAYGYRDAVEDVAASAGDVRRRALEDIANDIDSRCGCNIDSTPCGAEDECRADKAIVARIRALIATPSAPTVEAAAQALLEALQVDPDERPWMMSAKHQAMAHKAGCHNVIKFLRALAQQEGGE